MESPLLTFLASIVASISTLFLTLWVERKNRQKQEDLKYVEEKVKIYEPIVKNLRHTLSYSEEDFEKFQKEILEGSYNIFFVYASENTVKSFNKLIDTRVYKNRNLSPDQFAEFYKELLELYKDLILAIRKDIYPDHKLKLSDVRALVNHNQKEESPQKVKEG